MNYFNDLVAQSLNRTREASLSVLGIADAGLRKHLSRQMSNELGADGCFLAPPVFEHTFGWKESDCTLESLVGNVLSPKMFNTLVNAHKYDFPATMRPYVHQLAAWKALQETPPKSVVITSGTGSGKTECFMVPILNDLITEHQQSGKALVGVRALFLYPLNALINSQQERLDAWTRDFGEKFRFCLYNGNTEESASHDSVRKLQKDRPNQVLSREALRKEPAPILMTNATMLEYMLIRQIDSPIIEISKAKKSLRWIVLDEAHTYVGSQAAELSLLLRRVIHAFEKRPEEIRFVATSATIADENANDRLRKYLADLAGVHLDQVVVIGGSRKVPDLNFGLVKAQSTFESIRDIETKNEVSPARFEALKASEMARLLRGFVVSKGKPVDLNELVEASQKFLKSKSTEEQQKEVLGWIDLMTGTRESAAEAPFLKLRAHFFQRMLHGLWSCVNPECSAKSDALKSWPFGNVYVTQRARCDCNAPVLELGFCNDCNTPHLLAEDLNGKLQQRSPYAGDEFALDYGHEEEDEGDNSLDAETRALRRRGRAVKLVLASKNSKQPYSPFRVDLETSELGCLNAKNPIDIFHVVESDSCCSECEHEGKAGRDFYRKAYLGAPFYVANAVPTVLEFCPDPDPKDCDGKSPEQLPGRGRKLITFTDSRQGTARMAVRMQQEAERSRLRGLVFELLRNEQAKKDVEKVDIPTVGPDELLKQAEQLAKMGLAAAAAELKETAKRIAQGATFLLPQIELSWEKTVNQLAASTDISQSIFKYNKYANPQLFEVNESGQTVARLLLAREFARRPKNQNSTETLGLIKIGYAGFSTITSAPDLWEETLATPAIGDGPRTKLTLEDWKDFLKVVLDFYVRENTFMPLDATMQRWMGSRFTPKLLQAPTSSSDETSQIKKWPQVKPGSANRLVKLLMLATGLDRTKQADADRMNFWLKAAWDALVKALILEQQGGGYSLKLETLTFSLPVHAWVCPMTHRLIDTTFRGLTPYLPAKVLPQDYRCLRVNLPRFSDLRPEGSGESHFSEVRGKVGLNADIQNLRDENLWTDISDRTVEGGFYYRTAEHSAQQSAEKLNQYEEWFKAGTVNVLNCSTTMEMGVDIGGISAVVMNNVPPHPANYLQRAGRAGRRNEARAIAYTLCKADPHNQRAFAKPRWPFETAIAAPGITLSSERIVQRHVNSMLLGLFLKNHAKSDQDRTKLNLKWFYTGGDDAPFMQFLSWIAEESEEIEGAVRPLVKGTTLSGRTLASLVRDTSEVLQLLADRWLGEFTKLNTKLAAAKDEPYKRALSYELERHENEYLLKDLATRAFLPGYGFPTNVVSLNTYTVEDFLNKPKKGEKRQNREDNVFSSKEMPTRGLDVAIREYAPGSQVVIDGRVFRSAGIGLHWQAGGGINEAQKFDIAWRCDKCGAAGLLENAYANNEDLHCSQCSASITDRRLVLRPAGFVTDFYESTTNDVTSQKFIRIERPRIQLEGEATSLPDPRCGFIRFGHQGSVFYHSSGEHEKGYAVCLACGRAESMTAEGELPQSLRPNQDHRSVGGNTGSKKEKSCSGNSVKSPIYLGYQTHTDVLEIFLKNPQTGSWLSNSESHQIVAMTIAVALRDEIAQRLGIASTEMGFGVRVDRDLESNQARSVIQLFDQVSGGAGFVLALTENIAELLVAVKERLVCDCSNICSCCLAGQDSRVEQEELDRNAALNWLAKNDFVQYLSLPAQFNRIPAARHYSATPLQFIRTAMNSGADCIRIALRGNPDGWDLGLEKVRGVILTWLVLDRKQVSLHVADLAQLPESVVRSLAILAGLGVTIETLSADWQTDNIFMVAQVSDPNITHSLYSTDPMVSVPSNDWLVSSPGNIWATSTQAPRVKSEIVALPESRLSGSGNFVLELTKELNGPVSTLDKRLTGFLEAKSPEFMRLIESDPPVSLRYSDRYLKSPWSLILLGSFLKAFKSEKLRQIEIKTLGVPGTNSVSTIKSDWQKIDDISQIIPAWIDALTDSSTSLKLEDKSYKLQHSRVLFIECASGKTCRIILDQGMGYWNPRAPFPDELEYDFSASIAAQGELLVNKYDRCNMENSSNWPTYITLLMD